MSEPANRVPARGFERRGTLARGGMGIVELAVRRQGTFHRLYALKRLLPEHRKDARYRSMFLDEARVAGMIRHANVVSVLDVGEDERGPYLVMDFIEGVTVAQLIAWASRTGHMLPVQLAARIVRQASAGIAAAHKLTDDGDRPLNLIHRDVSPQNILIGFDGVVRVTDFGIAKSHGRITQSTTSLLKGKAGYMAPEQLRFEDATQASDLFGLGVVFYELLASMRLYAGEDSAAIARRILGEAPPDIFEVREDVHPAICELLFSLLAKTAGERPQSASQVVERLDMVIDELGAEEGNEPIERFLAEHFSEEIRMRASLRQRALQGPLDGLGGLDEPGVLNDTQTTRVDPVRPAPEQQGEATHVTALSGRSRRTVGGALAAALAAGLALLLLAPRDDAPNNPGPSAQAPALEHPRAKASETAEAPRSTAASSGVSATTEPAPPVVEAPRVRPDPPPHLDAPQAIPRMGAARARMRSGRARMATGHLRMRTTRARMESMQATAAARAVEAF